MRKRILQDFLRMPWLYWTMRALPLRRAYTASLAIKGVGYFSNGRWAEIPERYGPSTTCYNRFVRWRKGGVWDRLLSAVSAAFEGEIVMIDSTCIRVHQHGATGKKRAPEIAAWDVPEAVSRAKSMPSLTLMVVPSPCA